MFLKSRRTFSTISNCEAQTELTTQRELEHLLLPKLRHKKKSKSSSKVFLSEITNFHTNTLRTSVRNNIKYQLLFSESPYKTMLTTISNDDYLKSKISNQKSRNKLIFNSAILKGRKINNKTNNTFYTLNLTLQDKRVETLSNFQNKTRQIIKEKYINSFIKKNIRNIKDIQSNHNEESNLEINNYETTLKLFKSYIENMDLYLKFLKNTINKETKDLEDMREKVIVLRVEKEKLNRRYRNMQGIMENSYKNKFFLLCVKNNTNKVEKFSIEDRDEYYCDMKKIDDIPLVNVRKTKVVNNKIVNSIEKKRPSRLKSDEDIIKSNECNLPYRIFKNAKDFKFHLDQITSSITLSLMKYNQVQMELGSLRDELAEEQNNIKNKSNKKNRMSTDQNNAMPELKLLDLKAKNEELINTLNNIPKQKIFSPKIMGKLYEIHKKVSKYLKKDITKKISLKKTDLEFTEEIEVGYWKLIEKDKIFQKLYPEQYKREREERDKMNRMEMVEHLRREKDMNMENQILKIAAHSKKVIFKSKGKVENSIKEQRFNENQLKKKIKLLKQNKDKAFKNLDFFNY